MQVVCLSSDQSASCLTKTMATQELHWSYAETDYVCNFNACSWAFDFCKIE